MSVPAILGVGPTAKREGLNPDSWDRMDQSDMVQETLKETVNLDSSICSLKQQHIVQGLIHVVKMAISMGELERAVAFPVGIIDN